MKPNWRKHVTTLLGAAAVAVAMGTAPIAAAAPSDADNPDHSRQWCAQQAAAQYMCGGSGNVQVMTLRRTRITTPYLVSVKQCIRIAALTLGT
jgi:hypothetical protein